MTCLQEENDLVDDSYLATADTLPRSLSSSHIFSSPYKTDALKRVVEKKPSIISEYAFIAA